MDQVVHCKTILSTETIVYGDICGARKLYEVCYLYSLLNEFTTVPMARVKGCVIAGPSNHHITFNKKIDLWNNTSVKCLSKKLESNNLSLKE
jgi:hypothetical protein